MDLASKDGGEKKSKGEDLLEYMPRKNVQSEILSDQMISNLVAGLPSYMRESAWTRVFCLS